MGEGLGSGGRCVSGPGASAGRGPSVERSLGSRRGTPGFTGTGRFGISIPPEWTLGNRVFLFKEERSDGRAARGPSEAGGTAFGDAPKYMAGAKIVLLSGDLGEGQISDQPAASVHHRQSPDLLVAHGLFRVDEV